MNIAMVSTHPPTQCGIAVYTQKLCRGLLEAGAAASDVMVLAEHGGEASGDGIAVVPAFSRAEAFTGVVAEARAHGVRVAHFQHAPDIFGMDDRLLDALGGLREAGVRSVVTLHTVFTARSGAVERRLGVARWHRRLGAAADALVVHTDGSRAILEAQGVAAARIHVIPHGTDPATTGDAAAGRATLGVPAGAPVVLFFGFIHMQKNIQVLVRAMSHLAQRVPDLHLVVAGKVGGGTWYNRGYLRYLRGLASARGVSSRVHFVDRFIDAADVPHIHAAAHVVALPHAQRYASASGVVHGAMAMARPMLCADGPKFEEVATHIDPQLLLPTHDARAWARAIERLVTDDALRAGITARTVAYADQTRWPAVATSHLELYGAG